METKTDRDFLVNRVNQIGVKFPSRQRFSLCLNEGKLSIITTENKSKIKIENEKFFQNRSILFSGSPSALLDIVDCQNAEEYIDHLLYLRDRWNIGQEEE
ncbi:hypothetical protein CSV75_04600 [Sporosarcina sp. P18a]|uniref:hypothetical protein n=1 Tax=Sporosarcina sp. P18a TaxID=2048259 RepID=UPI000C16F8BD|nr:hypothetical protein [Sporosarcina sp. P18a]PIC81063.1 hypothetical protein CSV75_04600 [Sporosarcina sp. P18a]